MKQVTQRFIADELGMSAAAVSKFVARGMPTSSVEAARAWHRGSVRRRMSSNPTRRCAAELEAVNRLWPLARSAMAAGRLDVIRPALSAALQAVPHEARHLVTVDAEVADALVAPVLEALRDNADPADNVPMSEAEAAADAEAMQRFWYGVLAEEPDAADHLALDAT